MTSTTCTLYPCPMLTELLYPLQDGYAPLHYAAEGGHTTCVEHLLSTPGIDVNIDVNIKSRVSWFKVMICMVLNTILYIKTRP